MAFIRSYFSFIVLSWFALASFGQDTTGVSSCQKAQTYLSNFQFKQALVALDDCYQTDPSDLDYLRKVALCHAKLGSLQEAKKTYLKMLSIDSLHVGAFNHLASLYKKESNYLAAMECYTQLTVMDSTNTYYAKQIAEIALKRGDVIVSLQQLQKAHTLNPEDIETIVQLSRILHELELFEDADSLVAKGRALDSTHVKLIMYQVKSAYKQKNYSFVIEGIHEAMTVSRDTSVYMSKLLGISYYHLGQHREAISMFTKVLQEEPDAETIHYYAGMAYKSIETLDSSAVHLEKAIDLGISDNISTYYTHLAVAYEGVGNYSESIKAYQAAYKSSKDKILLFHLARNYDSYYQDKQTALHYYERYLSANDSENVRYNTYSKSRVNQIKQVMHFEVDTLN